MHLNKRGQVWIETVIYLLIGLGLIALILTFAMPKINEQKDRAIVQQTANSFYILDSKINEVVDAGKDNKRIVDFTLKAGEIYLDAPNNAIVFILSDLTKPYSEPGIKVPLGRILVETTKAKGINSVNLTLQYSAPIDITFKNEEAAKKLFPASIPYKMGIENKGLTASNDYQIDISLI